ncbi:MAG: FtsH protease activity modulator HflK [Alphaproteobacteria bacterium]|nr:FtsH protease activity modulator HflK [Alphaproteobacteria bacterium]
MPWNQGGGGGPWGGGGGGSNGGGQRPNNPWGGRPPGGGGGGSKGPDFEDVVRKGQEQRRRYFPGGRGGGSQGLSAKALALGAIVLVAGGLATGFYRVEPANVGVVLRFGEMERITYPGLNWHMPYPVESVIQTNVLQVNQLSVGFREGNEARRDRTMLDESLMLTSDQNILDVRFTVQWRIADASKFLFNVASPEITVKSVAEAAMRETIGLTPMQPIFQNRNSVETRVKAAMQSLLDFYEAGIAVDQVQFRAVEPPQQVIDAFRDVQRAIQDRQRAQNEAESYRNDIVPRARGEAQRLAQEAEGYRQQIVARATGDVAGYQALLEAYRTAPDVTRQRLYLEMMENVLRGNQKVIIDQNGGGASGQGVVPLLPLNELLRRPAPATAPAAGQQPQQQGAVR